VPAARSSGKATGAIAMAPADSLTLHAVGDSAAAIQRTVPMSAARDSMYRARADSMRAAQRAREGGAPPDTTQRPD